MNQVYRLPGTKVYYPVNHPDTNFVIHATIVETDISIMFNNKGFLFQIYKDKVLVFESISSGWKETALSIEAFEQYTKFVDFQSVIPFYWIDQPVGHSVSEEDIFDDINIAKQYLSKNSNKHIYRRYLKWYNRKKQFLCNQRKDQGMPFYIQYKVDFDTEMNKTPKIYGR